MAMNLMSYCSKSLLNCSKARSRLFLNCAHVEKLSFRGFCSSKSKDEDTPPIAAAFSQEKWSWIPPRKFATEADGSESSEDDIIPVIPGVYLNTEEIAIALNRQGAENLVVMTLPKKLDTIVDMVIVSGRSKRHLKKMADTVVTALQSRGLKLAPSYTGYEGGAEGDDDWLLVDCYNCVVHVMLPITRKAIDLESHWSGEEQPVLHYSLNEKKNDANLEDLLEKYPVPEEYANLIVDAHKAPDAGPINKIDVKKTVVEKF